MTTIPHHNVVVQQGSYVLKALNTQRSLTGASEPADSDQPEREELLLSVIQGLDELTRVTPIRKEPFDRSRYRYRGRRATRFRPGARYEKRSDGSLDTYA